jgi:pimeloyl-ACP methyl ester carboxylesterase
MNASLVRSDDSTERRGGIRRRDVVKGMAGAGALLALSGCTGDEDDRPAASTGRPAPGEGMVTTSDGAGIHYVDTGGDGPAVVLVPGWSMSTRFWREQLSGLAEDHRVVAIDPRGYGESEKVEYGHRLARHAADIRDVLAARDLSDVTLVGWSLAANVLFAYYELFGDERVGRMVYVEASPYAKNDPDFPRREPGWSLGYAPVEVEQQFIIDYRTDPRAVVDGLIDAMFTRPVTDADRGWMTSEILKTPVEVAVQIEWDFYNADWRSVVPRVGLPMLVVSGMQSQIYPVEAGAWLADRLPNGRHVTFDRSGHLPFFEEPQEFNEMIRAFSRQ